ncbi:MAG: cytochrome C552 [Lysobacterales bacterium]|nr:MAG: cytochrome C552 [Xanthomonadales bacterium]
MRAILFSAALVAGAATANAGDVERGGNLALRWCVSCHVVAPDTTGGDAGPAFASVASRSGQTEQALRNWLADPHPPMPDLGLAATEFDDIASYIMSLKQ